MPTQAYTYDYIPTLRELLPKTAGLPGVEYLQCVAANQFRAEGDGWMGVHGARSYVIQNPEDPTRRATMVLLAFGKPIPGVSPFSGSRECFVDLEVEDLTGLKIESEAEVSPAASSKKVA